MARMSEISRLTGNPPRTRHAHDRSGPLNSSLLAMNVTSSVHSCRLTPSRWKALLDFCCW